MNTLTTSLMAAGIAAALLHAPAARAFGGSFANAVDVCQGSLPSFEGALRKRPLGINNEGGQPAFVSCSMRVFFDGEQVGFVSVVFHNRSGSAAQVSCTLVSGIAQPYSNSQWVPVYQPKTIAIVAGSYAVMQWTSSSDNANEPYVLPNLNCVLAPGTEINIVELQTS